MTFAMNSGPVSGADTPRHAALFEQAIKYADDILCCQMTRNFVMICWFVWLLILSC